MSKVKDGAEQETAEEKAAREAEELEQALPEPTPMGVKGQLPLPVGAPPSAKKNVAVKVKLTQTHAPGAGQLDINKEHMLVVRAQYLDGSPKPKRDGEGQVIGFDYVQTLRPTWTEELDTWLDRMGLKIVRKDEDGEALDTESLANIEEMLSGEAKGGALD